MGDLCDRFPPWSQQETKELLAICSQLDRSFMETKRNKHFWEVTSQQMKQKDYNRTADQCKCKWKNLVTRYKGREAMEPELAWQVPFYEELHGIFAARMQRLLWLESVGSSSSTQKKKQRLDVLRSADGFSDDGEGKDAEDNLVQLQLQQQQQQQQKHQKSKKKPKEKLIMTHEKGESGNMQEVLQTFLRQQQHLELQWLEAAEATEHERRGRELEWRQAMETLETERLAMEMEWREKKEQRRVREEARSEKRNAILTAILTTLVHHQS